MKHSIPSLVAAACLTLLPACQNATRTHIDQLCQMEFPSDDEPGAMVMVIHNGEIVFAHGYGTADLSTGEPIDAHTSFNIASCSKQFTAYAMLNLIAEGKATLDDPVSMYCPQYKQPFWQKITIRHLLSHTSGIPDARGYLSRKQKIYADEELSMEYFKFLPELHFEPGTAYEYMNPTYCLIGRIIEKVSGMSYDEYLQQLIFTPVEMNHTFCFRPNSKEAPQPTSHGYEYISPDAPGKPSLAVCDVWEKDGWREYDYGEDTFFATVPDGGIYSCMEDVYRWEMHLQKVLKEDTPLSALLHEAMSPQIEVTGSQWSTYQNREDTYYGYGWFWEPSKGCNYHPGDNGGYKILFARYPQTNSAIFILANRDDWDRYEVKTSIENIVGITLY